MSGCLEQKEACGRCGAFRGGVIRHGTRECGYRARPDNRRILVRSELQLRSGVGNGYRESNMGRGGLTDVVKFGWRGRCWGYLLFAERKI